MTGGQISITHKNSEMNRHNILPKKNKLKHYKCYLELENLGSENPPNVLVGEKRRVRQI